MVGYADLDPYGSWQQLPDYGPVWFPHEVATDWVPYGDGYWTNVGGWGITWVDYAPWGYAPFHYGRWAWDRYVGWLWVPGTDWAPAWVAWQQGDGYIGWAPLPPADFALPPKRTPPRRIPAGEGW
mgnify:CR=1 FL=1